MYMWIPFPCQNYDWKMAKKVQNLQNIRTVINVKLMSVFFK